MSGNEFHWRVKGATGGYWPLDIQQDEWREQFSGPFTDHPIKPRAQPTEHDLSDKATAEAFAALNITRKVIRPTQSKARTAARKPIGDPQVFGAGSLGSTPNAEAKTSIKPLNPTKPIVSRSVKAILKAEKEKAAALKRQQALEADARRMMAEWKRASIEQTRRHTLRIRSVALTVEQILEAYDPKDLAQDPYFMRRVWNEYPELYYTLVTIGLKAAREAR